MIILSKSAFARIVANWAGDYLRYFNPLIHGRRGSDSKMPKNKTQLLALRLEPGSFDLESSAH